MHISERISPTLIQVSKEVVTPDIARGWLETMAKNRDVTQSNVDKIATAMKEGEWIEGAGDPLRFNQSGQLIDGQHRLWGVIESGKSFTFLVIRNVPDAAMNVIDTGRPRHLKDFLELYGEHSPTPLAAALRYFQAYQSTGELVGVNAWRKTTVSINFFLRLLEEHPGLRHSITATNTLNSVIHGGLGRWAAFHYVLSNIDTEDALAFFDGLTRGNELEAGSPILLLRNRLIQNTTAKTKMNDREYSALVFKSWNLFRTGAKLQVLAWKSGGAHPEEYPTPV